MKLDSAGKVVKCGDGEQAVGVLLNKPAASGDVAELASLQRGKVKAISAGALATIGTRLASDANGFVVAAASGDFVVGIQLEVGATNQLVEMLCLQSYKRES
jgi:hypothetical protein